MPPLWGCCFRGSIPEPLSTPIKVRSVHFEPPASDVRDLQRASHFRFQESDLDDVNSHYEVPPGLDHGLQPRSSTPPSPPLPRPPTTSCDEDRSNDLSYERPLARRKVLTKTRSRPKEFDHSGTTSAQIENYSTMRGESIPEEPLTNDDDEEEDPDFSTKEEMEFLRAMVHKLNVELSKRQSSSQSRLLDDETNPAPVVQVLDGDTPPAWLHDLRKLAPLLIAFEEEINEKEELIHEYENELQRFKSHYQEMVQRQDQIFAMGPIDPDRYLFLKENAEIVLAENDLLKDKMKNLKKCLAYSEDVLGHQVEELKEQLAQKQCRISELELTNRTLEQENKRLSREAERSVQALKDTIPLRDHEDAVASFRTMMKKIQETQDAEFQELSKQKKSLEIDNDDLRHRLAKLDMALMQVQCENKVYKKMVNKFEDLTMGLKHQIASASAERDQLRSELMTKVKFSQHVRKSAKSPGHESKELKILARIHRRLLDLKMSASHKDDAQPTENQNEGPHEEIITVHQSSI